MEDKYDLTIVGGGITGLAAAYIAARSGKTVRVLEGSKTFGGLLNTFEIGGNRLEFYYHHFFTHDAEINWLIKELGIADKLFFKQTSMGVYRKGKIYDFNSPLDLFKFKPIKFIDKFKFGLSSLYLGKLANWEQYENTPAIDWFYKNAGTTSTDALWKPMHDIKFGPYAKEVPLAWMVGRLKQRFSSRKSGEEQLGYIEGSLQVLLDALLAKLKDLGVQLLSETKVESLMVENNTLKGLKTNKGELQVGKTLFTIPTIYLKELTKPVSEKLTEELNNIEYFGAVCTILEMKKPLSEIYWLNMADEGFPFGGVIEQTNFIPKEKYNGKNIAYLSRYFAHSEAIATMSNEEIKQLMVKPLKKIYPNFSEDDLLNVHIFKTMTAATVCDLNFSKKIPNCKTEIEGMYLASMPHIYPDERSTNNSIRLAAEANKVMGVDASFVPYGQSMSGKIGFN